MTLRTQETNAEQACPSRRLGSPGPALLAEDGAERGQGARGRPGPAAAPAAVRRALVLAGLASPSLVPVPRPLSPCHQARRPTCRQAARPSIRRRCRGSLGQISGIRTVRFASPSTPTLPLVPGGRGVRSDGLHGLGQFSPKGPGKTREGRTARASCGLWPSRGLQVPLPHNPQPPPTSHRWAGAAGTSRV